MLKQARDILSGWSAEGSDGYAHDAKKLTCYLQKAVVRTFHEHVTADLVGGSQVSMDLDFFMTKLGVPEDSLRSFARGPWFSQRRVEK